MLIFASGYWLLRFNMIELGSQGDIHDFAFNKFLPSLQGFIESFWWQNMQREQAGWFGIICFALSILAFKRWFNMLLFTGLLFLTMLIYWGMFAYYQQDVINHLNFIGRLYLIPATLLLIALILWARPAILALIAIPLLWGGWQTYLAHQQFQTTYLTIFQLAAQQENILLIDYKENPLNDPIRKVQIGDYPQAKYKIDTKTGKLLIRETK
jgi:hypothetical protein